MQYQGMYRLLCCCGVHLPAHVTIGRVNANLSERRTCPGNLRPVSCLIATFIPTYTDEN